MIEEELIYRIDADVAGFVAQTANAKASADGVKEALSKGTRELTKTEIAALAAAEATKKMNKAAVDVATSAERVRRQFEQMKVPAAGMVQSIGSMASGLLGVVGKVSMVVSGFKELYALSKSIDDSLANWDVPEWLISTAGSKMQNAHNRARLQVLGGISSSEAALTLGAAVRDRNAGYAELARQGNAVTAGVSGFRNSPGLAGVIAQNTQRQDWVAPVEWRGRQPGGRAQSSNVLGEISNDLFGMGGIGTSLGTAASDLAAGFRGATSGYDASSTAGALFGGSAGGVGLAARWADEGSKIEEFTKTARWADEGSKIEEFTKTLQDNTTAAGAAFSALSGGIAAAVDAAITGSASASQAFARAAQAAIRSTAAQAVVKAAWEGAEALGSLAIGDGKGAATHGLAALKYAGIAALAGVAAAGLGSGGSGGVPAGGGSGAATFSGGSGIHFGGDASRAAAVSGGSITVIVQGATFLDAAGMGAAVQDGINKARRQGRIRDGETAVSRTE